MRYSYDTKGLIHSAYGIRKTLAHSGMTGVNDEDGEQLEMMLESG